MSFPRTGLVRLSQILAPAGPVPVSKSTWWAGVKDGRFPKPLKLGPRTTVWRVDEIRALFEQGAVPDDKAEPIAPDHGLPTPVDRPYDIADGHPRNMVGAILTALQIEPTPGDLFWFGQEHKADAAGLARLAGGEDALIEQMRRVPAAAAPKGFRRLTALAGLVKEGRG